MYFEAASKSNCLNGKQVTYISQYKSSNERIAVNHIGSLVSRENCTSVCVISVDFTDVLYIRTVFVHSYIT
jgi:hypothetical protein